MDSRPSPPASPSLWRQRPFVILWLARAVSVTGSMASVVAVQWWVLDVTGSAQVMATVYAVSTLVMALAGLPAGVWVDRWHRGRLFVGLELARGAVMAALAVALFSGQASVPLVLALLAMDAAGLALFMPLSSAIWPELVPPAQLAAANGLVAAGENTGRVLGPALGGLLATWHAGWAALADAVSYGLSALAVLAAGALGWGRAGGTAATLLGRGGDGAPAGGAGGAGAVRDAGRDGAAGDPLEGPAGTAAPAPVARPRPESGSHRPAAGAPGAAGGGRRSRQGFWRDLGSGWQAVFGRRELGAFFILVSVLNLVFSAAFVLIPVLARQVLQTGPQGLGWLQAAFAGGALAGGAVAGAGWVPTRSRAWMQLILGEALLTAALGWSRWLPLSLACGLLFGLVNAIVNVAVTTMLQAAVPADLRGRVFGLLFTVAVALQPLGQLAGGTLADHLPVPYVFTAVAVVTAAVLGAVWWRVPELRRLVETVQPGPGTTDRAVPVEPA